MRETRKAKLQEYLRELEEMAVHAEELMSRMEDPEYRDILQKEVKGYRDLIEAWRTRLRREFPTS